MRLSDMKRYRGYMPVRMEREDILYWLGGLIGGSWLEGLWLSKYSGYHELRYRFGDVQEAQVYMKDGGWLGIPLPVWLKLSEMDVKALDGACWSWINGERSRLGTAGGAVIFRGGLLDI